MLDNTNIMLVGCGSMGSALLQGWIAAGVATRRYTVVTPHLSSIVPFQEQAEIRWASSPEELPAEYKPDIIVLAVKPQILNNVLRKYYEYAIRGSIFITIAAGKEISSYRDSLGEKATIIRMMPNLAAAYGKGTTAGFAENSVSDTHLKLANYLFEAVGKVIWVESESLFHPITAVSGSGPAYFYLMVEALTTAAVNNGIETDKAEILARQTMIGAATLLEYNNESASTLRARVTSPGGVTAAALEVLDEQNSGLKNIMNLAIANGTKRSKELSRD